MWSGRSTPPRTRTRLSLRQKSTSWSKKAIFVMFYCTFLVFIDIEFVTSMSIERLNIERNNELQSDKRTDASEQKNSDIIVKDEELEAVPAGGETELYVLLPAGSKTERESINKNTIESDDVESSSMVQENGGDMIMMESQDAPVMQNVNLLPVQHIQKENEMASKDTVDSIKTEIKVEDEDEEKEKGSSDEQEEDEPIKQVFKNDKDIENMDMIGNESDKDTESNEDNLSATQTGDAGRDASVEEPESMVDLLADVVEEVGEEIKSGIIGEDTAEGANKDVKPKDEEHLKWEETVEKLEEKGSEKQKEEVAEDQSALEAVIEELMPEEVVEAMSLTEITDISSEEEKEKKKEISKNEENKPNANAVETIKDEEKEQAEKETIKQHEDIEHKDSTEHKNSEETEMYEKDNKNKIEEASKIEAGNDDKTAVDENKHENLVLEADDLKVEDQLMEETEKAEETKPVEKIKIENMETIPNTVETEEQTTETVGENEAEIETEAETVNKENGIIDGQHEELATFEVINEVEDNVNGNEVDETNETTEKTEAENEKDNLESQEALTQIEEGNEMLNRPEEDIKKADKIGEEESNAVMEENATQAMIAEETQPIIQEISNEESNKESIIIQADEQPILIEMDTSDNGNNKAGENLINEIINNESKPLNELNKEDYDESQSIPINEPINEIENKNDAPVFNYGEATITKEEELQQQNLNENTQNQEILLPPPQPALQLPQKTEEHESTNEKETDEMPAYTMLTTIIQQKPSQEEENQKQQQHKIIQQVEMHTSVDSKIQNEQISGDLVETTQVTIVSSTKRPQNVAISSAQDSVLNYVNTTNVISSTFMIEKEQQKQKPLTTESTQDNKPKDSLFNSQLRSYDGAQVWRIVVQNDRDRRLADELQTKYGGQLWKEVKQEVDYLLKPQMLADAEKHIRAANLSRIVLIDNLQKVIEVENPIFDEFADADNEKGYRLTWHSYHRLADIHEFVDYLAKTYPEICSVETIGYSIEKRPLKVLKISNGNDGNPSVWIDAGMHAREWISPASVTYIANQIAEGWENLPSYMQNINWYIHAVANPDGYEYTHTTDRLWRKNMRSHGRQCPGVDLNRNFGFKWGGKGTSANPCSQIYRGSKAFSEPETFYISKFISNFPRDTFHAFLSFHSYGQYILYPWGYDNLLTNDKSDLERVARAAATTITRSSGSKYTVGPSAMTLYPAAGGSDDWAKGIANIKYTYTIEMGDTGRYGFILPANQIESNGKDAYTFVQTVARAISHDMRKRNIKLK